MDKKEIVMGNMWHVKNWFKVGRTFSWKLNFHTMNTFLGLWKPFAKPWFYKEADKKHAFILDFFRTEFSDTIEKYRNMTEPEEIVPEKRYIWTLWWQGEETAPILVKECLRLMDEHRNGAELVIITKDNVSDWIDIPQYILDKRENGTLSFAQLSDIIRLMLLSRHGGLWLDSTIYLTKDLSPDIWNRRYYSLHTKWTECTWVQHNIFHGFVLGNQKNCKLSSFVSEMLLEYWKRYDVIIDYFAIDYLQYLAYLSFPDVKEEMDSLDYTSERLYDMVNILGKPYDGTYWNTLKDECPVSKLDWHRKYKAEKHGKPTYWSVIFEGADHE